MPSSLPSSQSSHNVPSAAALEKALRQAFRKVLKSNPDDVTVRKVRNAAEQALGLDNGFFKEHNEWNKRSKDLIHDEVEAQDGPPSSQDAPPSLPVEKDGSIDVDIDQGGASRKKGGENKVASQRAKTAQNKNKILPSETQSETPNSHKDSSNLISGGRSSERGDGISKVAADNPKLEEPQGDAAIGGSESEMSVVLNEDPRPRKKSRTAKPKKESTNKAERLKANKPPRPPGDPENEEIKRLQGWLIKCGIRKIWHKELAPHDTGKAKIQHLKKMLADVGMTGRYSNEKATDIREARELKADLEAVQAGNKQWGKSESEDERGGRPRRKLARGLRELDFLNDDDGAETD
ncbi:MAG: hypothetical protein LQ351_003960 [Letrouitia transgressa]|nr:MAG: hypothetical protein LQ351_003960 [Letrouitia transgressa]